MEIKYFAMVLFLLGLILISGCNEIKEEKLQEQSVACENFDEDECSEHSDVCKIFERCLQRMFDESGNPVPNTGGCYFDKCVPKT